MTKGTIELIKPASSSLLHNRVCWVILQWIWIGLRHQMKICHDHKSVMGVSQIPHFICCLHNYGKSLSLNLNGQIRNKERVKMYCMGSLERRVLKKHSLCQSHRKSPRHISITQIDNNEQKALYYK